MKIVLNGKPHEIPGNETVSDFVAALKLEGRRVAVMVNEQVVKKDNWNAVRLNEGDAVEVVHMVGGG